MGRGGDPTGVGQTGGGGGAKGGGKGTGTNVEKQAPKKKSKFNCVVCSLTTNTVKSNRDWAVQCGICDLWWHPTCAQISKERFQIICAWMEQDGSSSPWKCASCDGAAAKVIKLYNALSAKMIDTEKQLAEQAGRVDRVEDKSKHHDTRLDSHDRELKLLREQMSKMGDLGGPGVVREMDERASKENNLVVYRIREADVVDTRGRVAYDKRVIQGVLDELGVDIGSVTTGVGIPTGMDNRGVFC
jgi:hypothetical protein